MDDLRMYCVFSKEALKKMVNEKGEFELGKFATQAGHGYSHALWDADKRHPLLGELFRNGKHARKITCVVDTDDELRNIYDTVRDHNTGVTLVTDSGFTVFSEPTLTCVGFGPITSDGATELVGRLKLLRKLPS